MSKLIKYMDYYGWATKKIRTGSLLHWTFSDLKRDTIKKFNLEGRRLDFKVVKVKLVEVKDE